MKRGPRLIRAASSSSSSAFAMGFTLPCSIADSRICLATSGMEKAGLHRRRPYDLRHTVASLLLTAGAPIAYVSQQMGHQNIQLTVKLYGHLQPGANRHWMNKLPGVKKVSRTVRKLVLVAPSGTQRSKMKKAANSGGQVVDSKSGTRDSNSRLQPWQGCTLPLS